MKKQILLFLTVLSCLYTQAATGDTVKMKFHDNRDFKCWGGGERNNVWTSYNPNGKKFNRAILKITLGCGSVNCCVWDYNFNTFIMKKTGIMDSSISGYDTISYTAITKNKYKYTDSLFQRIDTITKVPLVLDSVFLYTDSAFVKLDTIGKTNVVRNALYKKFERINDYELGRLITPYGADAGSYGFIKGTKQPYMFDITDYLPLFNDSFGIGVITGGYDNVNTAFSVTSEIFLIEGNSAKQPKEVKRVYFSSYGYAVGPDALHFDTITKPLTFMVDNDVAAIKFRATITGHGGHGEFTPHDYYVDINGDRKFTRKLWKSCDVNAVSPQAGTWIFSRCNWCPGEDVQPDEWDLTPFMEKGKNMKVDINMEDFELKSGESANYQIYADVITYTSNTMHDAALVDIVAPSADKRFQQFNPVCRNPIVRIKNEGKEPLKRLYIDYWVDANNKNTYKWLGNMRSGEIRDITLPTLPWEGINANNPTLYVELQKVGDNADNADNDKQTIAFSIVPVYNTEDLKIEFKTTNKGSENTLIVRNEKGDTVFSKKNLADNTAYSENVNLPEGCYSMEFYDYDTDIECGDGVSFWFSSLPAPKGLGKTSGYFRLKTGSGSTLKNFNGDFGRRIIHQFSTNNKKMGEYTSTSTAKYINGSVDLGINPIEPTEDKIRLFPNPAREFVNIQLEDIHEPIVRLKDILGNNILIQKYQVNKIFDKIDLTDVCPGVYFIEVESNNKVMVRKLVVE